MNREKKFQQEKQRIQAEKDRESGKNGNKNYRDEDKSSDYDKE